MQRFFVHIKYFCANTFLTYFELTTSYILRYLHTYILLNYFAGYADDNTHYVSSDTIDEVIKRLETASVKLLKWFPDNQMKANRDKCYLIVSKNENISMHIGPFEVKNTNCEKLLGIKAESRLNFNEHLDGIIKKASRKINALSRITPFMNISKRCILMNTFFNSQFNYCPLVWMFHSRSINNKINRLHERVLRIVYNDFTSSFKNLLEKDETVSIHVKKLQKLATEMFKISKNFSVPLTKELFYQKVNHYDLRNPYEFSIPNVNSFSWTSEYKVPRSTHMVVSTI